MCVLSHFSHVWLFATPWTVAHQAPLSMGFSRQEYWGDFSCPPPGYLPDPGVEPMSLMSPALQVEDTTKGIWDFISIDVGQMRFSSFARLGQSDPHISNFPGQSLFKAFVSIIPMSKIIFTRPCFPVVISRAYLLHICFWVTVMCQIKRYIGFVKK